MCCKIHLKNLNKVLIIDLDDTLINTTLFKKTLFLCLAKESGLNFKEIQKIYDNIKKDGYKNLITKLCKAISANSKAKEKLLESIIYERIKEISLKKKIIKYVKNFSGIKILLTLGDRKIQSAKIKVLKEKWNIDRYFNKVIIINQDKLKFLKSFIKSDSFRFW